MVVLLLVNEALNQYFISVFQYTIADDAGESFTPLDLSTITHRDVVDKYSLVAVSYIHHQIQNVYNLLSGSTVTDI